MSCSQGAEFVVDGEEPAEEAAYRFDFRVEGVGAVRFRAFGFEGFGLCRLWLQGLGEELWGLFRASGLMWEPDYGTLAL